MTKDPEDSKRIIEGEEPVLDAYANLASERASVYGVLSRLLLRPLRLDEIQELSTQLPSARAILEELEGEEASLAKMKSSLREVQTLLRKLEESGWEEACLRLSTIHTRLFRGLSKKYSPPPPYESVYAENETLWGNCTLEVQNLYGAAGFEVAPDLGNEPPDHVALELGFMACLCRLESDALQRRDRNEALRLAMMELDFLKNHILSWMPAMRRRISSMDELGFYSGILELVEGWIEHDATVAQQTITALTAQT